MHHRRDRHRHDALRDRAAFGVVGRAAMAAIRVKGHYLEAQYRRLKPRRGHKRALGAVKHTMICAIWHMLSTGETYRDLGGDYFTNRDPERQTRRLVAQLERLGHHVTLTEEAAAAWTTFPVRQKEHPGVSSAECSLSRIAALVIGAASSAPGRR